jgi:transketolase
MSLKPVAMRDAFLERIWHAMGEDKKIFFTCADFGSPVLDKIRRDFPDRYINVGIAEQNLINVSAGLALEGYTLFAYAIAPFITMRCFEQIRVNLALLSEVRKINVNLIGVGAGYSYVVSGPTHQCYEDLTLMRALPNVTIYSPADHVTATALYEPCAEIFGPKYLRLDAQVVPVLYENVLPDVARGFNILRQGKGICLVATGYMVHTALKVADRLAGNGIDVGVIDLFNITGFDPGSFQSSLRSYAGIVTLEEGFRGRGGLDAMMFDFCERQNIDAKILNLGVEGAYRFELGTRADLHEQVGIGVATVEKRIATFSKSIPKVSNNT